MPPPATRRGSIATRGIWLRGWPSGGPSPPVVAGTCRRIPRARRQCSSLSAPRPSQRREPEQFAQRQRCGDNQAASQAQGSRLTRAGADRRRRAANVWSPEVLVEELEEHLPVLRRRRVRTRVVVPAEI